MRADDNPALHAAARRADRGVIAVYTICPQQWQEHDVAPAKVDFIFRNLHKLSKTLVQKNIALKVIVTPTFDGVARALRALAHELGCDALYFNREYEVNERRRDDDVAAAFEAAGAEIRAFTDQCLFEPGFLRTGEGRFYTVFTPFKRAWQRALEDDRDRATPLGLPRKQPEMIGRPDEIPECVEGFEADPVLADLWPAGERAAQNKLTTFIQEKIDSYRDHRDRPACNGTSTLSPYLASGIVSPRRCLAAAFDTGMGRTDGQSTGAAHWISELVWRDFYKHILVGFPRVSMYRAFQRTTEQIRWNANDEHFGAWCEGRTGYPIVDAAMRQLAQTGWMHNRLRMIVAMFLSKNLFLDWRLGERYFMRHLVDGDLSANNGGWQWAASTGTDAAPYFRVFNPCSQSKKCDPDGEFIRRFVPELDKVESRALHDPARIPAQITRRSDYPEPIVDHTETRRRAIEVFRSMRDRRHDAPTTARQQ